MWKCELPLVVSWRLCGPAVPAAAFARKWERFNSIQHWAASMTNSLTRLASLILTEVYPLFVRFLGNDSTSKYLPNRICQVDFNFNPKHNLVKASTLIQRLLLQVNNFLIYKWRRMEFLAISWQPNLLKPCLNTQQQYIFLFDPKKVITFWHTFTMPFDLQRSQEDYDINIVRLKAKLKLP